MTEASGGKPAISRNDANGSKWLRPVRRGLHELVVEDVGYRIVNGSMSQGEVLIEADLSDQTGTSRSIVREAIKVLASKGLVASRPKVGITIRPKGDWNMLDPDVLWWRSQAGPAEDFLRSVFDVRRLIEPGAAAMAAQRADDHDIERMTQAYAAIAENVDDTELATRSDCDFHISILIATKNEILRSLSSLIETGLMASFSVTTSLPNALDNSLPIHGDVLHAIRARNPARAAKSMNAILDDAERLLAAAFEKKPARSTRKQRKK